MRAHAQKPARQHERENFARQQQLRENALLQNRIRKAKSSGYGYVASQQVPVVKQHGPRVVKERNPLLNNNRRRDKGGDNGNKSPPRRRGQGQRGKLSKDREPNRGNLNGRTRGKRPGHNDSNRWRDHDQGEPSFCEKNPIRTRA